MSTKVVSETPEERVELREYRYSKVKVVKRGDTETRDLVALKLNPWWYPHDLYTPATTAAAAPSRSDASSHSSRSVGFTGWIGGVAGV